MRNILLSSSALILLFSASALADERPLSPRIDTGFKLGTERGIVTTEIWVPVRQAPDRVLYGDARLTGDDGDNFEGNLGGGYRHIYGDTVLGAHGWIDRRKTARGSTFNQATVGVEALGRNVDARLNAYVPLSGSKTYATPNAGRDAPYLAGSGVFYDTAGTLVEEPQGGFDIELGARVPLFEERVDSIRVFGGFYHFGGDETPDVTGWRARVSADVTPQLQLGARFQKDSERGSQGFLEATLRFPGKASFRREGLRARLDESPERDIDIVTGSAVTDTGIAKPVLDPSGNPQRVLHVDNTVTGGGKGTNEKPYSTLKAAEAAMKPYDVIYVHEGDGGTTGQNRGIVIDKPGVSLIGSGVDLVYEGGRVTGAAAGTTTGSVLAAATAAPVITNTQAAGDGVFVTAGEGLITGLTVSGAQRYGIYALAQGEQAFDAFTVRDVTTSGNGNSGVLITARNGSVVRNASIENIVSTGNTGRGVSISIETASSVNAATIAHVESHNNGLQGVQVIAQEASHIGMATIKDITTSGNTNTGVRIQSDGVGSVISSVTATGITSSGNTGVNGRGVWVYANTGEIGSVSLSDVTTTGNSQHGIFLYSLAGGHIASADVDDATSSGNVGAGISFQANGMDSLIASASATNVATQNNTGAGGRGVYVLAQNNSEITLVTLEDILALNNAQQGVLLQGLTISVLEASLSHVTANGNAGNGIYVDDDTTGAFTADLGGGTLGSVGGNRIYGNTGTDLRVDLDGGLLKAENNWWGVGTGLAGGETTLDAASTVDADPFLAADPGL